MLFIVSGYFSEIEETDRFAIPLRDKYIGLKKILERGCKDITQNESLQFPSLFSRLVFISQKYDLPQSLDWQLQTIRKRASFLLSSEQNTVSATQYEKAKDALESFFYFLNNGKLPETEVSEEPPGQIVQLPMDRLRVQLLRVDKENEILVCRSEQSPEIPLNVRYKRPVNDIFNPLIERLWVGAQLNLIDVKIDQNGYYIPSSFVLEPDYLIDVSAIAACFCNYGNSHLHYFRQKFEPDANSKHILLGNLANFFLDELVYAIPAEEPDFDTVFFESFRQRPFEYASCNDISANADFREFMVKALIQFNNIRRVVNEDMPANGFSKDSITLEPSFFCEKYGFQGRLDLLQLAGDNNGIDRIIELKSGKTPFPSDDPTRIAPNHMAQTVVYRLMIESVFNKDARNIYPMILYSAAERAGENLRYAARFKQLEKEILQVRNLIIATEHDLYIGNGATVQKVFDELFNPINYNRPPQFFMDKLEAIKKVLDSASSLERAYFYRFISFISRELYLLKAGDESYDSAMSVSALWNSSFQERKDALELIDNLEIQDIDDSGRDMVIRFSRRNAADCVNFRQGEICILYPKESVTDSVLTNQILKGVIAKITTDEIVLRFRYKQRNRHFFARYRYWTVEHDKLDHSYNAMFKSLFAFLSAAYDRKELLLGVRQPRSSFSALPHVDMLSKLEKQEAVLSKAMAAEDYFLIVGPPGTGKTSLFALELIRRYYSDSSINILVMAYTNRAVDELCEAICNALDDKNSTCDKYIRIGTELSCGEPYRHRLLQHISYQSKSRKELLEVIGKTRIFVGTLASIVGKPELFGLKHFNVAIIDEASQILEPQIVGLLPRFDKFIMIGDHKQLSTITLQAENKSKVDDAGLNDAGLFDCRESLFERLFNLCRQNGWQHAYDTLTYHGRMHQEIADLVNIPFYNGQLVAATERQTEPLHYTSYDNSDFYQVLLTTHRTGLIHVRNSNLSTTSDKMNESEADEIVSLSLALLTLYKANDKTFDSQRTLGIITPYRNQIALIKQKLYETGIPEMSDIMVDTVERYQGSQRDVILISFCFNKPFQLQYFSNMNHDGTVDRKLNVALTRAREQLFLVGNDMILFRHPVYKEILGRIPLF